MFFLEFADKVLKVLWVKLYNWVWYHGLHLQTKQTRDETWDSNISKKLMKIQYAMHKIKNINFDFEIGVF